ncbi:MAG: pentapeptide repeat-containing protein [Alistipes sp.]|jgi:uncharacterized protein YjbI with pentapeptide repeats|nr:pentapeptide repeat-containing protein [Alistipes sp.]
MNINEIFREQNYSRQSLRNREFDACRMTLTVVTDAVLRRVVFKKSDLRGIDFETVAEFGFGIACEDSRLDNCSFVHRKMKETPFRGGELRECYFAGCDLSGAIFDGCLMSGTTFEQCNLSGIDLRTAIGYIIDPLGNRVVGARFSEYNLAGLVGSLGVVVK